MARGDDYVTASKASKACQQFDVTTAQVKKPQITTTDKKQQEDKKNYGPWGPIYKDRKNFNEMHFC